MRRLRRLAGSALRRIVRVVLRPSPLRRIVESALRDTAPGVSAPTAADRSLATPARPPSGRETFVDRHGTTHALDPELRDRLKPSWRTMLDPAAASAPPTDAALRERAKKAATTIAEANALLAVTTGRSLTGRILEIGCYDGSATFAMAAEPGANIVGSDLAHYYIHQRGDGPSQDAIDRQQTVLAELRERAGAIVGIEPGRVSFVEDDITVTALEPGTFDAIVSFEVLEHVLDPLAGFTAMAALLRPAGVLYHDYNPFFAINGGHSLVTLDFSWGHARLDDADVERYLKEIRPTEYDQALRFYRESLNRMTRADLLAALDAAGLEAMAIIPWTQRSLIPQLTPDIVREVQRTYPGVRPEELLQTFVGVVARKPG